MALFNGLQVVELATVLAGPAVGQFLAELGATVTKIEPPTGDVTRSWRLADEAVTDGRSAYFSSVNWGKRSLRLNLKDTADRARLYTRTDTADIVIANYRPGDDTALGVDAATLRTRNPRLIYAHLTGYGADQPRPGYDAVVQAEAGFLHLNGQPDGPPNKMPVALMDLLAAHQLKEAILCALYHRERTGQGATVHVSLIAAGLSSLANQAAAWLWAGQSPQRIGSEHPSIVPYGTIFATADGKTLILAVGTDRQFADLCHILQLDHLSQDEQYATNPARVRNRASLLPVLAQAIGQQPSRGNVLAELERRGVPAGAGHDIPEATSLHAALHLALRDDHGQVKGLRTVAFDGPDGWTATHLTEPPSLP